MVTWNLASTSAFQPTPEYWQWAAGQTGGASGTLLLAGEAFGLPSGYMVWYDSNTGAMYALNKQTGAYDFRYMPDRPDLSNWPEGATNPGAQNWDFAYNAIGQTAQATGYESVGGEAYTPEAISEDTKARQERTAGYGQTLQDILESGQVGAESGPERVAEYRAAGTAGNTPTTWAMLGGITATPNEVQAAIDAAVAAGVPMDSSLVQQVQANLQMPPRSRRQATITLPPGVVQLRGGGIAQVAGSPLAAQPRSGPTAADIDRATQQQTYIPEWMRGRPTPRQMYRAAGQPVGAGAARRSMAATQPITRVSLPAAAATEPAADGTEAAPSAPWLQNLQTGALAREWEFPMADQPRFPTAQQWFRMSQSEQQGLQGSVEEHGGSWPDYYDWMIRSWVPGTEKRLQPQWMWR